MASSGIYLQIKGRYLHIRHLFNNQTRVLKKYKIINIEFTERRRFTYWFMPYLMTIFYAKHWVEDTSFYVHKIGYINDHTIHEDMKFQYKLRKRTDAVILNRKLREMDIHTTFNIKKHEKD